MMFSRGQRLGKDGMRAMIENKEVLRENNGAFRQSGQLWLEDLDRWSSGLGRN
jgi:hypothetical protein